MERKVNISRRLITTSETFNIQNVVELAIENYSLTKVDFVLSNIVTEIPPATKVEGIIVPSLTYRLNANGDVFERLDFTINIPSEPGKVILNITSKKC